MNTCLCVCSVVSNSATPYTVDPLAPQSMKSSRQEYWGGLPFPAPGDLLVPGVELSSLASPTLADRFFTTNAKRLFSSFKQKFINGAHKRACLDILVDISKIIWGLSLKAIVTSKQNTTPNIGIVTVKAM